MKKTYLICHKMWDVRNRRISAFGVFKENNNTLKIYIITCSKKDTFSRKEARRLFTEYVYKEIDVVAEAKPLIFAIPCFPDTYRQEFLNFLHDNYFVKEELKVAIEGTNKMLVADCYCNQNNNIIKVCNNRIVTLSPETVRVHEEYMRQIEEQDSKLNSLANMLQTFQDKIEDQN